MTTVTTMTTKRAKEISFEVRALGVRTVLEYASKDMLR